ncbi:MAG: ABC transporter substrate-binding protein [Proteobacteria bacterium]|nr:ABC transporter substrate-binding protein [Pseudomonadota bacterium]
MKKLFITILMFVTVFILTSIAMAAEPIKIGSPLLLSGRGAFVGGAEKETLEMMAEEVNKSGGINGRPIEFVFYDTEGKPDIAVSLVKRLIQKDKVDMIIGISASWAAFPVIPIIEKHQIPTIMLGSANQIVNPVNKYVFKTPADDKIVVSTLLNHLKKQGIKRIAILSSQDGFGDGGRSQLTAQVAEYGIEIVFDDKYTMDDTDITPTINKIKKTDAEVVINWSSNRAPVIMTQGYRQIGMTLPLYQSHAALSPDFLKATGENGNGVKIASFKFPGAQDLSDNDPQKKIILDYQAQYEKKFGKPANQFGACAFDAFNIAIMALKKAGTDKEKLRDAIETTKGYIGINGKFNYSPEDHGGLTKESMVMYEAINGEWKLIK